MFIIIHSQFKGSNTYIVLTDTQCMLSVTVSTMDTNTVFQKCHGSDSVTSILLTPLVVGMFVFSQFVARICLM